MIIALDLATHTGWAVHDGTKVIDSGVWDMTPRKDDPPAKRPADFYRLLFDAVERWGPESVAYEQINALRGLAAVRVYLQLETVLLLEAHRRGLPLIPLAPATIKRHATGKGNADKTAMAVAAARRWPGWTPEREDDVDARWIAEAAVAGVRSPAKQRRKKRPNVVAEEAA